MYRSSSACASSTPRPARPVRDSAVEIWHCDASGVYSGYTDTGNGGGGGGEPPTQPPGTTPPDGGGGGGGHATPTDDLTWLRGIQMTDRHGFVTFRTVFPGWYTGRAVHVHTKVHTGGARTSDGYEGGRTCHTGQFYFAESAVKATEGLVPYSGNTVTRVTLDEDMLYPGTGAQGGLLDLSYDHAAHRAGCRRLAHHGRGPRRHQRRWGHARRRHASRPQRLHRRVTKGVTKRLTR